MTESKNILVTIQIPNFKLVSKEDTNLLLTSMLPAITENILVAASGGHSRGCSVSGSVSAGTGGISGTIGVTCR